MSSQTPTRGTPGIRITGGRQPGQCLCDELQFLFAVSLPVFIYHILRC